MRVPERGHPPSTRARSSRWLVTHRRPSDRARGRARMNPEYDYLFKLLVRVASDGARAQP